MDANTVTLLVGTAGLVGTLGAAGVGFLAVRHQAARAVHAQERAVQQQIDAQNSVAALQIAAQYSAMRIQLRRDAYAGLVDHTERVRRALHDAEQGHRRSGAGVQTTDVIDAMDTLWSRVNVIRLEGPEHVAELARELRERISDAYAALDTWAASNTGYHEFRLAHGAVDTALNAFIHAAGHVIDPGPAGAAVTVSVS